jgi:hypothetical protein
MSGKVLTWSAALAAALFFVAISGPANAQAAAAWKAGKIYVPAALEPRGLPLDPDQGRYP